MRWIMPLLLIPLAGCWVGPDLYRGARPQAVLPAGDYQMYERGREEPYQIRVDALRGGQIRATNMTGEDVEGEERERFTASFFALAGSRDRFVVRVTEGNEPAEPDRILYAMIERRRDGSFGLATPVCEDDEDAAAGLRAELVGGLATLCVFRSRRDLERALRALPAETLEERRLVPVRARH